MGVTIEQPALRAAVARVRPALGKGPLALSAEAGEVCMTADDGDLRVSTLAACTDGNLPDVLVPWRALSTMLATTPKDRALRLDYDPDGERLRIVSAKAQVTIPNSGFVPSTEATLFPARKRMRPADPDEWKMSRSMLEACRHALAAVGVDESRPILRLVQVNPDGTTAATDSYRLATATGDDPPSEELLFDGRALGAIPADTDEILVSYDDTGWMEMACDSGTTITQKRYHFVTRDGGLGFPNWRSFLLDSWPVVMEFDRDEMIEQLRGAVALSDYFPTVVAALPGPGIIELHTKYEGPVGDVTWESAVDATTIQAGPELRIGFTARYLLDGVRAVGSPRVRVGMIDGLKAVTISDPELVRRYVLMPVRRLG